MLSEHERRELATIEQELLQDTALSACFAKERGRGRRAVPGPRCLVIPGLVIMLAAALLDLGVAFAQGLGLVVLGFAWWAATNAGARRRARRSVEYCVEAFERSWLPPAP